MNHFPLIILLISIIIAGLIYHAQYSHPILKGQVIPESYRLPPLTSLPPIASHIQSLTQAQHICMGQVTGVEHMLFHPTSHQHVIVYAGLSDGRIVKISWEEKEDVEPVCHVETVVRTGNETDPSRCDSSYPSEPSCGRPLGLAFLPPYNDILIADAYYGLMIYNITTKALDVLTNVDEYGNRLKFTNAIAVDEERRLIYFTDSSSHWQRRDYVAEVMWSYGTGRLLVYDLNTHTTTTLASNLYFPNGLLLSHDHTYIIMAETTRARIQKIILTSDGHGIERMEVLTNVPCIPDNLEWDETSSSRSTSTFWIGCGAKLSIPFSFLHLTTTSPYLRLLISHYLPYSVQLRVVPRYGLGLRVHVNGTILESIQDPTGRTYAIAGIQPHHGYAYAGSPRAEINYIARTRYQ